MLSSALLISLALVIHPGGHSSSFVRLTEWGTLSEQRSCPAQPMGALPKSLANITASEFAAKVRSLKKCFDVGVPDEHRRLHCVEEGNKCPGSEYDFPKQHAKMSVFPIDDSHQIDPDNLPANGVIIAKIHNLGRTKWKRYLLPEDGNTPRNWYLVLTDDNTANEAAKIAIIGLPRRNAENSGAPARLITLYPDDSFRVCHKHETTDYPEAQFSDCEVSSSAFPSPLRDNDAVRALVREYRLFQPRSPRDGVWLRCSLGCCSTGPLS
jgi:hypothetical protein